MSSIKFLSVFVQLSVSLTLSDNSEWPSQWKKDFLKQISIDICDELLFLIVLRFLVLFWEGSVKLKDSNCSESEYSEWFRFFLTGPLEVTAELQAMKCVAVHYSDMCFSCVKQLQWDLNHQCDKKSERACKKCWKHKKKCVLINNYYSDSCMFTNII